MVESVAEGRKPPERRRFARIERWRQRQEAHIDFCQRERGRALLCARARPPICDISHEDLPGDIPEAIYPRSTAHSKYTSLHLPPSHQRRHARVIPNLVLAPFDTAALERGKEIEVAKSIEELSYDREAYVCVAIKEDSASARTGVDPSTCEPPGLRSTEAQ